MVSPAAHRSHTQPCSSCGAGVEFGPRILSTRCPYCDSPAVDLAASARSIDRVAPFRVERQVAGTKIREWLAERWFAPENLRKLKVESRALQGMLVPAWLVDGVSESQWSGQVGIAWTRTEHYTDSEGKRRTRTVREMEWFPASGGAVNQFEDHLSHAGGPISAETFRQLPAFDLGFAQPFDERWLSGFVAYAPDRPQALPREQIVEERKRIARTQVEQELIPGDKNRLGWIETKVELHDAERVLIPLWRVRHEHKGQVIDLWIHGQSGVCLGRVPTSATKVTAAIVLGILLIFLAWLAKGAWT